MSLFDKFQPIVEIRAELQKLGVMPFGAVTEKILSSTEAIVNGHKVILAGTNNYLGLTFDPECIAAAKKAVEEQGTGTTGSRMANGTFTEHVKLEQELAAYFDRKHAIVFSTGYAATMGMGSTLAGARRCHRTGRRQPCQHLRRRAPGWRRCHPLPSQ